MSVRYHCDVCNKLIKGRHSDRVRRVRGNVMIEVMVRYKNVWNAGHICEPCVIKVVTEGESAADGEGYLTERGRERVA